ncbi:MAG: hypothetical protein EPN22_02885 [Nitrospirae bacterium]|nr:MAG: hypothetical protein EPN22_02885 [Nitrospirota bacterium]
MKLGILVNTDRHPEDIEKLTVIALAKGHEVDIFAMDSGTRLLELRQFTGLSMLKGVRMSYCDHSAGEHKVKKEDIPAAIVCGSQFNNAAMVHDSDRVLVL